MTTLTVLSGLPGSGKTTLAKRMLEAARDRAGRPGTAARVSRDDIREHVIGLAMTTDDAVMDRPGEDVVTAVESAMVAALLDAGVDVVVDATNLRPEYVDRWREVAARHGADLVVRALDVPVDECVRRVTARAAAGGRYVEPDVIRSMAAGGRPTYETGVDGS